MHCVCIVCKSQDYMLNTQYRTRAQLLFCCLRRPGWLGDPLDPRDDLQQLRAHHRGRPRQAARGHGGRSRPRHRAGPRAVRLKPAQIC